MNKVNKALLLCLISISFIVLIEVLLYSGFGGYSFRGNSGLYDFSPRFFYYNFFIYSQMNYTGLQNILNPLFADIVGLIGVLSQYLGGLAIGAMVYLWVMLTIGATGMFFLINEFNNGHTTSFLIFDVVASSLFIIGVYPIVTGITLAGVFLPYFILFFYRFTNSLEINKFNLKWFFLSLITFEITIAVGGTYYFVQNFIFFIVTISLLTLILKNRVLFLKYSLIILILALLINASSVISTELFITNVQGGFMSQVSITELLNSNSGIFKSLFAFEHYPITIPNAGIPVLILLSSLFVLSVIIYLLLKIIPVKLSTLRDKFICILFFDYLFFMFFSLAARMPFGQIFTFLLNHLSFLLVFRSPYTSIFYINSLIIYLLFGVGISEILIASKKHKFKRYIFVAAVIVFLITYLYIIYYYPSYLSPNKLEVKVFHNISKSTFQISNFINNNPGTFSVATLPVLFGWEVTRSYYSTNIYTTLIEHPTFVGGIRGKTAFNDFYFPISAKEYISIGAAVDLKYTKNVSLSNAFGVLGIRYIIIMGNEVYNTSLCDCGEYNFSFKNIYSNLNNSGILFVKKFGNSSIYENSKTVPLTYASDVENIGNASTSIIFNVIENDSFNIQNDSVYSAYINGFYNDSNTINATPIANFVKPNITFVENTPTKVTVHVSNAITPYYLVFRETYDPHWAAFYSNGTEVNPRDHIAVNGFANAWYMNKTGNYTVTLYYTLQTDAWIAWGVSFAALFVTVGIGVYGWKKKTG